MDADSSKADNSHQPASAPVTPMMKQWAELKAKAPSALLLFRLGDFYELFAEDAIKAAPLMGVTLTSRNSKAEEAVALCGIPVSQLEVYLPRLLDKKCKVALAEQLEEAQGGKTLVRRGIVQWFTPGMRFLRSEDRPHYIATVDTQGSEWILVANDISTGHLIVERLDSLEALEGALQRLPVEDLRWTSAMPKISLDLYNEEAPFLEEFSIEPLLLEAFGIASIDDLPPLQRIERKLVAQLYAIISQAHPRERLRILRPHESQLQVWMTEATKRNLHLFEPAGRSLFDFLNHCMTALGRRTLKQWMQSPSRDYKLIQERQHLIGHFKNHSDERLLFRKKLSGILDLHRLLRRRRNPYDRLQILESLESGIASALALTPRLEILQVFRKSSEALRPLVEDLARSIESPGESGPTSMPLIRRGISPTVDDLRQLRDHSQHHLLALENQLREAWGIPTLKVKFHQILGYIAEVSAHHRSKVPDTVKRVQNLANADRFKTPELIELEAKILSCEARLREAEDAEWARLDALIESHYALLLEWLHHLAHLDVAQSLAEVSSRHQWTTPQAIADTQTIRLLKARHPLVSGHFVPLTLELSENSLRVLLLTGPNMAGKSTVLRTTSLMAYLHQIGSDIPAESGHLSLFDRILCRMGAADDLVGGQSTFLLEMREVASLLQGASPHSLLVFDEIGRGTSTYDGMSLSWAITEYVEKLGAMSLMATHYLELAELETHCPHLQAFHLGVEALGNRLLFTRELLRGPASRSYGIHVARMAQIPESILKRAEGKLHELEKKRRQSIPVLELWS